MINPIELIIDNQIINGLPVWAHFQRDPWPGGHRYCLRSTIDNLVRLGSKFREGNDIELSMEEQAEILTWLEPKLSGFKQIEPPRFVLNNVTSLSVSADRITLVGDCSPFVQSSRY